MLYIKEADDNVFTREVTSSPTWQMINRLCNNYGYQFDPYARVEIDKNGKKSLESIAIKSTNDNFPIIECEERNGKVEFTIQPKGTDFELTLDEYENYTEMINGTLNLINELIDIDFYELYEDYIDE